MLSNEEYVSRDGTICPSCGGIDVHTSKVESDVHTLYQDCTCGSCGAIWTDEYKLTGYGEFFQSDKR